MALIRKAISMKKVNLIAAIAAGLGLWWLWDKVHDAVQDKKDDEALFKDEPHEQAPKE